MAQHKTERRDFRGLIAFLLRLIDCFLLCWVFVQNYPLETEAGLNNRAKIKQNKSKRVILLEIR